MTYDEALAFWYGRINYEQRPPRPDDLKLEHMQSLLSRLGQPQDRLRILHVAGSKGKGSTSALLAAILQQAGYRTGLFTSPHLCRVEERFQVNGQPIHQEELIQLLTDLRALETGTAPENASTFFELATAIGFLHFIRRRADAAVVEVGLGGRFDSTNVCRPEVSLITSISLDHTKQLGDRIASIAREKAGIIKPRRPVISGATDLEARTVIEAISRQRRAPLRQLGVDFRYEYEPGQVTANGTRRARVQIQTAARNWPAFELGLLGEHQAANAAVAVVCVEELRRHGWHLPDAAVATGLAEVSWPARLEVLGRRPLVVLDCAHNVASAQALVAALQSSFPSARRQLIFAASNDKDVRGMFRVLAPHFERAWLTRYTQSPRSFGPEELAAHLRSVSDLPHDLLMTPTEAWEAARQVARPEDLICITGSVFLAGELRPLLMQENKSLAS